MVVSINSTFLNMALAAVNTGSGMEGVRKDRVSPVPSTVLGIQRQKTDMSVGTYYCLRMFCYDSEQGIDGLHMSSGIVGRMPELRQQHTHIFRLCQQEEVDIVLFSHQRLQLHLWDMVEEVIMIIVVVLTLKSANDGKVRR